MRDSVPSPVTGEPLPLAVVVQPDPMLEDRPAGTFRTIATGLGAAAIVILALYGMTRPPEPQQMAAASDTQTAPAGAGPANSAGGRAPTANAPAQDPQPNTQQPTTTGQGAGERAGQLSTTGQGQPKGQAGHSKTPPASGGSATSDMGPGARPAPQAK
jgi:hypothetical protein